MATMTEEWVILWYQCLSENYDYSKYADARLTEDVALCREYEKKFPLIADIFADFGKLRSLDDCDATPDTWWWTDWFEPRRHLFMPSVAVLPSGQFHYAVNSVVLSVPLAGTLEETIAAAASRIKAAYAQSAAAGTSPPKYRLREEGGKPAIKFDLVRHAVITSISKWSYQPSAETGDLVNKVSIHFLQRHLNDMGWRLGDRETEDLIALGYVDPDKQESFRTLIGRNRRLFRALSRNTIRASFPDNRPFKSQVWDRFQMEQTYK